MLSPDMGDKFAVHGRAKLLKLVLSNGSHMVLKSLQSLLVVIYLSTNSLFSNNVL